MRCFLDSEFDISPKGFLTGGRSIVPDQGRTRGTRTQSENGKVRSQVT